MCVCFIGRTLFNIQKKEKEEYMMKLTKIVQKSVSAFFGISIILNMLIPDDWGIITLIGYYVLWFSFGIMIGVFLLNYAMRKDIDNAQKQLEKERENRPNFSVN